VEAAITEACSTQLQNKLLPAVEPAGLGAVAADFQAGGVEGSQQVGGLLGEPMGRWVVIIAAMTLVATMATLFLWYVLEFGS
jgi:hypothetical protein